MGSRLAQILAHRSRRKIAKQTVASPSKRDSQTYQSVLPRLLSLTARAFSSATLERSWPKYAGMQQEDVRYVNMQCGGNSI